MTLPIKEIKPVLEESGVIKNLIQLSAVIDEFVNYGTHILKDLSNSLEEGDSDIPILFFFRDLLEKSDAISSLVKVSSADSAKIILRSVFETSLQIEYLLEKDREKRGLSFLIWHNQKQINFLEHFQPNTTKNKKLRRILSADKSFNNKSFLDKMPDVGQEIQKTKEFLEQKYKSVNNEYERTQKQSGRPYPPQWYQLYDGPKSIKQLAEKLKKPFMYEILYNDWSKNAHGTDIFDGKILIDESTERVDGSINFSAAQLNLPTHAQSVTAHLLEFLFATYQLVIDGLLSEKIEELKGWFSLIQEDYRIITQGE